MKAAIIVACVFVCAGIGAWGVALSRIDRNHEEIARVRASIPAPAPNLEHALAPLVKRLELQESQLHVCKMRTEWIRNVVETFVPIGDRVRIPDPPPGWDRWPTPKPEREGNAEVE